MRAFSLATALLAAGFVLGSPTGAHTGIAADALPDIPTGAIPGVSAVTFHGVPTGALPGVPTGALPGVPTGGIPSVPAVDLPGVPTGALPSIPTGALPDVPTALPSIPIVSLPGTLAVNTTSAKRVDSTVYNDLMFYFKYASSAYITYCPRPNGNALVYHISDLVTDTQGYVARDDKKREIVVALRGSASVQNFLTDAFLVLTPLYTPGFSPDGSVKVHIGFLNAWNSVAQSTITIIRSQLSQHPGYTLVVSGHSLGGALASLAGISFKRTFPNVPLRMFTYGQPRTGNPAYARLLNKEIGSRNIYRGVHTSDGVPTIIPVALGYHHHGTEYWSSADPVTAENTRACDPDGEDYNCSAQYLSTGINPAHTVYYNILASTPYCF